LSLQWLDHSPEGHALRRVAIYLLARLCNHSKRLPPSLFKSDVIIRNQEQTDYWGGFADVFEGQHLGKAVAVKRLRVRENREEFNKVCVVTDWFCIVSKQVRVFSFCPKKL
jgi:hypothetical protein